jgi:hypothetical protein
MNEGYWWDIKSGRVGDDEGYRIDILDITTIYLVYPWNDDES